MLQVEYKKICSHFESQQLWEYVCITVHVLQSGVVLIYVVILILLSQIIRECLKCSPGLPIPLLSHDFDLIILNSAWLADTLKSASAKLFVLCSIVGCLDLHMM